MRVNKDDPLVSSRESTPKKPLRVLHILGSLRTGGAETWLVQVAPFFDPGRLRLDVAVNCGVETQYMQVLRKMGWRIYTCPSLKSPVRYARGFLQLLKENGPYDIVHSHLQLFNGLVMRLAAMAGVPVRIAHIRNSSDGKRTTPVRSLYRTLMRHWLRRYSTIFLSVSRQAAIATIGPKLGSEKHCEIVTAIDFTPFTLAVDKKEVRKQLGIPLDGKVVGNVGSFTRQKNHGFLLKIAQCVCKQHPDVIFLLIGDGPLKKFCEEQVRSRFQPGQVRFLGERRDVPALMLGAMDCFLLPSLYEGMPRVLLEAQAAGLPALASSVITDEAVAYPDAVRFVSLESGPEVWAVEVLKLIESPPDPSRGPRAIKAFTERGFTPEANARFLTLLYERAVRK